MLGFDTFLWKFALKATAIKKPLCTPFFEAGAKSATRDIRIKATSHQIVQGYGF